MAGNVYDWTAEALSISVRTVRGYVSYATSNGWFAGVRGNDYPTVSHVYGSRMSLYIPASSGITEKTYVKNGLILHLDGINNTGNGHNDTSMTWKDLSGNNNNGTVKGASWLNNGLSFDGINDYVPIAELNYPEFTVEVTFEASNLVGSEKGLRIICNHQTGGFDIEINNNSIASYIYINGEYKNLTSGSMIEVNKKYNVTMTTNGSESKLYVNGILISNITVENGSIGYPLNNTVLALGTNPNGSSAEAQYFNGTIYSTRMYNRVLTEQEIKNNYEIDKSRFEI